MPDSAPVSSNSDIQCPQEMVTAAGHEPGVTSGQEAKESWAGSGIMWEQGQGL